MSIDWYLNTKDQESRILLIIKKTSLITNPIVPIIANPRAHYLAIFINSFLSGFSQFMIKALLLL